MSQLMQIAHEAWIEAKPAISWPAFRGYMYAAVCALVLVSVGRHLIDDVSWTFVIGLLAGLLFFLQRTPWTKVLGRFLSMFDLADLVCTSEADRAQSIWALKQMIVEYAARAPDWDGMDGIAPRADAIADALAFIDHLPDDISIPIKVYAPGDGEVLFQWLGPATLIEVGFYGDDTISWYARTPGRPVSHGDDPFQRRSGRQLPPPLVEALLLSQQT